MCGKGKRDKKNKRLDSFNQHVSFSLMRKPFGTIPINWHPMHRKSRQESVWIAMQRKSNGESVKIMELTTYYNYHKK